MQTILVTQTQRPPMKTGCDYIASLITDTGKGIEKKECYGATPAEALKNFKKQVDAADYDVRFKLCLRDAPDHAREEVAALYAISQEEAEPACKQCEDAKHDTMMPRHTASSNCESGKRPHCTCEVCY